MNYSDCTAGEIATSNLSEFVLKSTESMKARFSHFIVTPEQTEAWRIGFSWVHEIAIKINHLNPNWKFLPEFSAPLISGRPDLVIDTGSHLLVVEMKTGFKATKSTGKKQVLQYADDLWGKIKIGRSRTVIAVLMNASVKSNPRRVKNILNHSEPTEVLQISVTGLVQVLEQIYSQYPLAKTFNGENRDLIRYSPRPSVVEAATSLVAALDDRNVITGLASSEIIEQLIQDITNLVKATSVTFRHQVVVVSGSPGSGKTLIGLRVAHDRVIQELLGSETGTPLYLTGNAPLVEVLTESLARDEVRRLGTSKKKSHSNASAKVRLIHAITEKNIGIESNVVVFDEGQRVWTESHMRFKKKNVNVGSEAEEILTYLERMPWAVAIVLLGEGQEINTGEAGLTTWLEAVKKRNSIKNSTWDLVAPRLPIQWLQASQNFSVSPNFHLIASERTDNAANVSQWTENFLESEFEKAKLVRSTFVGFPIYYTRDLAVAKKWLRENANKHSQTCGLVASSKSKRLLNYGVDPVADANRAFNWANWYLNRLPDLNSSSALEIAATEYKCQGLELDWIGLCWSWDLVLLDGKWKARTLDSARAKWRQTEKRAIFQLNAYRVLLTRARKGMVIWIPKGDDNDLSRSIEEMNYVAAAFAKSGIEELA